MSRCRLRILRQPKEGLCASATAAAVAVKSNARVTISAALAAGVAGWDDSRNARLPPGSLFIGCGQDLFLYPDFNYVRRTLRHLLRSAAVSFQLSLYTILKTTTCNFS